MILVDKPGYDVNEFESIKSFSNRVVPEQSLSTPLPPHQLWLWFNMQSCHCCRPRPIQYERPIHWKVTTTKTTPQSGFLDQHIHRAVDNSFNIEQTNKINNEYLKKKKQGSYQIAMGVSPIIRTSGWKGGRRTEWIDRRTSSRRSSSFRS